MDQALADLAGAPETRPSDLRGDVLAGRFFGAGQRDRAARLAAFLAEPNSEVATWRDDLDGREPEVVRALLDRDIAAIDALISAQVDSILHAPRLRRLEGSWRGLAWMLGGIDPSARVKVRLLAALWSELVRDLERAAEFDQSNLFRRIYEDEFGMPGGEPYGLLVIDQELRHTPQPGAPTDDSAALTQLAAVAAAAFTPVVLSAAPALLDVDDFRDLSLTIDPASCLRDPAHARFRRLSQREDSRFIALALPRLLARLPWKDDPSRHDGFRYVEHAPDTASRIWMSAGYGFAATAIRAHANHGWPADLRGVDTDREGGGLVTYIPAEGFSTEREGFWLRAPLDLVFNDRQERSLVDAGLMPLTGLPFSADAAFIALRSLQMPKQFQGAAGEAATANARISAQFNAMLCVSRFAHYVKVIGRDMAGSFKTEGEIQQRLQDWLNRYVNTNIVAGPEARAKAPLVAGKVTVQEQIGRPGSFGCTIFLQPHFQLDDVSATFRLTTEIAAPGRS